MPKYNQGYFEPENIEKYIGNLPIIYRSAWELTFMNFCDNHPNIIQWASECLKIAYQHPHTGKWHRYIPDFLVVYIDIDGNKHGEIIEIKPKRQAVIETAKTKAALAVIEVNHAKWEAAIKWCEDNGLTFRVMTQEELYRNPSK